jgi:hypothetical protein
VVQPPPTAAPAPPAASAPPEPSAAAEPPHPAAEHKHVKAAMALAAVDDKPSSAREKLVSASASRERSHSARDKVQVDIVTTPAGADVCLVKDRVLLGKTPFRWNAEQSRENVKFLVRKTGYRGQEIAVSTEGDGMQRVDLDKLGPDDIDDVVNCRPR